MGMILYMVAYDILHAHSSIDSSRHMRYSSFSSHIMIIKSSMGLRVSREEELSDLDVAEHGVEAYAGDICLAQKEPT